MPVCVHLLDGPWNRWIVVQECKKWRETVCEDTAESDDHVSLTKALEDTKHRKKIEIFLKAVTDKSDGFDRRVVIRKGPIRDS